MNRDRFLAGNALRTSLTATTLLSLASLASVLSLSGNAFADPASAPATPPAADAPEAKGPTSADTAPSPRVKEATARFERGLALYDDQDFDAALVEFNRAYELSPTYKILYNIAKIERLKNDYSSALTHFKRYLDEGKAEVSAERRDEVEKEIAILKDRVASITIKGNVAGAAVYIDDVPVCGARISDPSCVGVTPLPGPVVVNPGTRKFTAIKQGYQNAYVQLALAGGDQNTVKLDLFDLKPHTEDTGPRTRAIVSWTVTGALAVGAGVMGVLALNKKSTYNSDRDKAQCENTNLNSADCNKDTLATLDSDKSSTKTFALLTDVLAGAAVVGGVVSIYFTVKAAHKNEPEQHAARSTLQNVRLSAGPGSAFLAGSF